MDDLAKLLLKRPHTQYRGRFAPSPSGLLHFGSLIAALASYLQAKSQNGIWLVRIDDIDKPREMPGATQKILTTLESYGLHWDESVLYQSQQQNLYKDILATLQSNHLSYYCRCSRAQIKASGGIYQGTCRKANHSSENSAIRLINNFPVETFHDGIQAPIKVSAALAKEDFIIHRRDGLFAYQLACVVDDIYQNISEVVRGCDLLEPTARQLTLFATFGYQAPKYCHVPLAVTAEGYKLSKQNLAPAIDNNNPQPALIAALQFLGQKPPKELQASSVTEIINWAVQHWQLSAVPKKPEISLN